MPFAYIGLGSNQQDRLHNLNLAIDKIKQNKYLVLQISPVYETPALLPDSTPEEWNQPFLNAVIKIQCHQTVEQLLSVLQKIEKQLGRKETKKWSPRIIDLDILLFDNQLINNKYLKVPHSQLIHRNFVLAPLKELCPSLKIPGKGEQQTVLNLYRQLHNKLPTWMNIINITPDSFSDGGEVSINNFESLLKKLDDHYVQILDIGAESTRPDAKPVSPDIEWQRLTPFIDCFFSFYKNYPPLLRPKLSVDTRHSQTAIKAIEQGADMINDVSGLNTDMLKVLKKYDNVEYVLTHSLSVPVSPQKTLSTDNNPVEELKNWLSLKIHSLKDNNISLDRIIFDPGIGFGKTPRQSVKILQYIKEFSCFPVRILVGHSRKSFMKNFSSSKPEERDPESMGISLALAKAGVDIIRVHKAYQHAKMFLGYSHSVKHFKPCHK